MFSFPGIIFYFVLLILFQASGLSAESLDIFNTIKPFPPTLSALGERRFDLGHLKEKDIPTALKYYQQAENNVRSSEEENLLGLAIGYLHYRNGDLKDAARYLKDKIVGNFILEDFRLDALATVLKELGQQKLQYEKYPQAIEFFKNSEKLRMKIFRNYPDSPFYANVNRDLAEIEYLLGKGYFLALNHKAAWQAFRRSLMRKFPENTEHQLKVNLALAKNYQSAGDLMSAADIYIYLLRNEASLGVSLSVKEEAVNFFKIYENKIKKMGIDLNGLKPNALSLSTANKKTRKPHAPRKKPKIIYNNELVRSFHESLDQDDLEKSLNLGLQVLRQFPGIQEARGVVKTIRQLLPLYLENPSNKEMVNQIAILLNPKDLNQLAYSFWQINQTEHASFFYEKIIEQYPLEISACHKALFFLGRIAEDDRDYSRAVDTYDLLLKKYDFGPYTTTALFKIPWIERLQKKYDLARTHFERLLNFYSSPAYRQLKVSYSNSTYQAAGKYWLAQTYEALGNQEKKLYWINQLAKQHSFDFYAILTQGESGFDLKKFLIQKESQKSAFRKFGLGEIDRKRLSRAEKLIALGFLRQGAQELANFPYHRDNPAFSFYIANLFNLGGDFQTAINLSWKLSGKGNSNRLSRPLAEGLYPKAYISEVLNILTQYDLDPFLILSLMRQESAFNTEVESKANAIGLMQLIPPTAGEVAFSLKQKIPTVDNLKEPVTNIKLGIEYLNRLMVSFNQNLVYALAAYNAGPTKVRQWVALRSNMHPLEFIESIPFTETRNYVKKILRNYAIYLTLYDEQNLDRFKKNF